MFTSKAHLLSKVQENADKDELIEFAKAVASHPLNKASIRISGSKDQIIESLMGAPKAVLERAYEDFTEDDYDPDFDDGDSDDNDVDEDCDDPDEE